MIRIEVQLGILVTEGSCRFLEAHTMLPVIGTILGWIPDEPEPIQRLVRQPDVPADGLCGCF